MKILFGGPSLFGSDPLLYRNFTVAPPAQKGDVAKAVEHGYSHICLVDGIFETGMSVWHKEIIHALQQNTVLVGAASMGALRAVECEPFGMFGVGNIFDEYKSGSRTCDSDVALVFGPKEMEYMPLTITQVDLEYTIKNMVQNMQIANKVAEKIIKISSLKYFKNRTLNNILGEVCTSDYKNLKTAIEQNWINRKQLDTFELIKYVQESDKKI